ncbi:MAG: SGNH/GDSL hydrolase family protein [Bauldia sp.]|nr:SGNH/GDSL hydrolase family protein [Bauldia sp.]
MATIVCYGDSNTWGCVPMKERGLPERFSATERWAGVLREQLGAGHTVIEEGLNGRTTCLDDPIEGLHKNGLKHLPVVLESHAPFDLLIIKLGTNDLKYRLSMTPGDIADGAGLMVDLAKSTLLPPEGKPPAVLLISPAPLVDLTWLGEMFTGGKEKSLGLAREMERVAKDRGVAFLDAGKIVTSSPVDGIHLDREDHLKLGTAVAASVREILPGV